MRKKHTANINSYITSLKMNGLNGRMTRISAPKNKTKEILVVYGHHSSLERMDGMAKALNSYGAVTVPDLPGFGGMDSFYKINERPTIDKLSDYLAAFIKLQYRHKKYTIVGFSFGFVIVTRMLQKYPEMTKNIDLIVAAVGFLHHDDLIMSGSKKRFFRGLTRVLSNKIFAGIVRRVALTRPILKLLFYVNEYRDEYKETSQQRRERINFEIALWQANDVRTHFYTLNEILKLNLCLNPVDVPVELISVKNDQYLDHNLVDQHMRVVFSNYKKSTTNLQRHAPTIITSEKEARSFIPTRVRRRLGRQLVL